MIKTGSTKAGLPKPGHQERSKQSPLSPGSSPNTSTTMRTSRSSHTLSSDQRQSKLKRSNSDDALTKPGPGVAAAAAAGSRMKKTVTIGAISDLAENRPRSLSGVPGLRKSGIPSPRDGPSTTTRDRLSLREQLKTSSTKRLVSSVSASGLSTATKPTRGTAKSQRQDSQEKSLLEVQMKELLAEAKLKDVEIGNLKEELDRCREKVASLASSSPHAVEDQEEEEEVEEAFILVGELREKNAKFQRELAALREENQGLKEKLINLEESPQSGLTLESNDPSSPVQTSVSYSSDITKGSPSPDSSEFEKIPSCSESLSSGGESVKKLEEQIHKMEESHHSTSEELQATLQELSDQQQVLQELTSENERLAEEKRLLQTSLQQHRERVEVLAQKNEALTGRIQEQAGKEEQEESRRLQELEQKYAELVENSLFEREKLVDIQQQLTGSLRVLEKEHQEAQSRVLVLQEEKEKLQERESSDSLRVENSRLRAEVDAERQKVLELLSVQSSGDGAELLLKTAHTERGSLEAELSELREGLLQVEDQQVQAAMSKVEAKCRQIQGEAERREVELFCRLTSLEQTHLQTDQQVKDMKETIFELEDQVEQQRAVNLHTNQNVIDLENLVKRLEEHKAESEQQLKLFTRQIKEEKDEWRRFQADLQTAVVVANDIKVEAQHELRTLRRQLQEEQDHNAKLSSDLEALQGVRINSATFDTKTAVEGH